MPKSFTKLQRDFYDNAQIQQSNELATLADLWLSDRVSTQQFREGMVDSLKQYYIQLALVAKGGRPLIARDRIDIGRFLSLQSSYLQGFATDLDIYRQTREKIASDQGVLDRSTRYSHGWGVFTRFGLPAALADALPALPGIDCLGGMLCGCWLEWTTYDDGVEVYWYVNGIKEHCALCAGFDAEWSPLFIPIEDLDPGLVEEEIDFLYD